MNKMEFLNLLRKGLDGLPIEDINDIIRDQEEYINDAMAAGKSEQVGVDSLGDPKVLAATLRAQASGKRVQCPASKAVDCKSA